jgi:proteasome accessory factor B
MNLSRIRRLLSLIGLLQAGGERTIEALARRCDVSRRTIFRDLSVLREAGVPLHYDAESERYRIPGSYYLPPTNFTPEEARSLILLCRELGDRSRIPFFAAAHSAMVKLESTLPTRLREQLRRVIGTVEIEPAPRNIMQGQDAFFGQLLDSLGARLAVRIGYASLAEHSSISTRLCPYRLLFSHRSWYVIGRSSLHRSVRTFNVGRIRQIEPLSDTYKIPAGFSLNRYLRNAWHLIPESGPDREVHIRFNPRVAQNVAEIRWHKTQRTSFASDGSLDYFVTVSGLHEISWWILGYGEQAEVIAPDELRQIIAQHAIRLAGLYAQGGSPAAPPALQ